MTQQIVPRPVSRLEPTATHSRQSPAAVIARALRTPIGSRPVREIPSGKRSAAILIPGRARVAGTKEYAAALIAELNAAGVPDRGIEVYLADGTHEQELAARVHCLGHDSRRDEELVELEATSFGAPVLFNRRVLAADLSHRARGRHG